MSPHCDFELEDSKSIFLHDTQVHDGASPSQVWLQKVQQLRRYCWDEHSLEFLTFPVTLTLTTTEQFSIFTRQSSSWLGAINQIILVAKGSAIQKTYYKVIFGDMILHCDLDLEDSKPIFLEDNLAHDDALPYKVW